METKKRSNIPATILLVLSAVLAAGVKTVIKACAAQSDGSYMSCHWAEQAVFVIALIIVIIALFAMIARSGKVKAAFCLATIPAAAGAFAIPYRMIDLCMMSSMRCVSIMKPAVTVLSAAIAAVALLCFIFYSVGNKPKQDKSGARHAASEPAYQPASADVPVSDNTATAFPPLETPKLDDSSFK